MNNIYIYHKGFICTICKKEIDEHTPGILVEDKETIILCEQEFSNLLKTLDGCLIFPYCAECCPYTLDPSVMAELMIHETTSR